MILLFFVGIIFSLFSVTVADEFYQFIPTKMVNLKTNSGFKLKTNCWNNIDIYLGEDKINLQYNDKSNLFCSDMILWGKS